jgi:DNA-binding MarR family transcriptional regulator
MNPQPRQRADVEVFAEIAAIDQLARNRIERVLPEGLSAAGMAMLNELARLGAPASPVRLARTFQLTKGAITNTLQRLEGLRLVSIDADPADGRRKLVALTVAGAEVQRAALAATRPQLAALREAFDEADFAAALPFLQRLRAWLAEHPS